VTHAYELSWEGRRDGNLSRLFPDRPLARPQPTAEDYPRRIPWQVSKLAGRYDRDVVPPRLERRWQTVDLPAWWRYRIAGRQVGFGEALAHGSGACVTGIAGPWWGVGG
jgi:hypothetical protein